MTTIDTSNQGLRVIVDMFSGLPNPEWLLDVAQSAKVAAILAGLGILGPGTSVPEPPALGYRGFEVSGFRGDCPAVRVFGAYVVACGEVLHDPDRRAESALLDFSKAHLEPATFDFLVRQTGQ
ncbi:MAG: hypothetical protein ACK4U0_01905 [Mesorhizobium sp.]